jgi:hypothetical protein
MSSAVTSLAWTSRSPSCSRVGMTSSWKGLCCRVGEAPRTGKHGTDRGQMRNGAPFPRPPGTDRDGRSAAFHRCDHNVKRRPDESHLGCRCITSGRAIGLAVVTCAQSPMRALNPDSQWNSRSDNAAWPYHRQLVHIDFLYGYKSLKWKYCRHPCESSVKGEQRCPGRVRENAQCVMPGLVVRCSASRLVVPALRRTGHPLAASGRGRRRRRLSWCSLPVPKQFVESLRSS